MIRSLLASAANWFRIRRDPVGYARRCGVRVGDDCRFLGVTQGTFGTEPYLVTIGSHVTITGGVEFITHDGGVWVMRDSYPDIDVFGPITIGDNVFIGIKTVLLPGVTVGDNCVIGAGSVVTRNIPAGSVAAGVPARVVASISEYEKRSWAKAMHVRSLPDPEKRRHIMERFDDDGMLG